MTSQVSNSILPQILPAAPVASPKKFSAEPDQKMIKTWKEYGWTSAPSSLKKANQPLRDLSALLVYHRDFVDFIRKSGLLYTIRGYQHSLDNAQGPIDLSMRNLQDGIKLGADGHPLLLKEGMWVRWEDLKELVQYDKEQKKIVSKANPAEEWNYFSPDGLCPRARYNQVYPTYQLTTDEMRSLHAHGEKFFQGNLPEELQGAGDQWHFMQVFTSDNSAISKISHVGLRLIDRDGTVHSLGFETPGDDMPPEGAHFAGTYNAAITSLDYDEFKPYKTRRVTTIPITTAQHDAALQRIKDYAQTPLRFNRLHQNCSTYVTDIMKAADHPVDISSTLLGVVATLPPRIPGVAETTKAVNGIFERYTPNWIKTVVKVIASFIYAAISWFSALIGNLISRCFLGADKGSAPKEGIELQSIANQDGLKYFDRLVRNEHDLWKTETGTVSSVPKLVHWQLDQESTHLYEHDGSPKFVIVPPIKAN